MKPYFLSLKSSGIKAGLKKLLGLHPAIYQGQYLTNTTHYLTPSLLQNMEAELAKAAEAIAALAEHNPELAAQLRERCAQAEKQHHANSAVSIPPLVISRYLTNTSHYLTLPHKHLHYLTLPHITSQTPLVTSHYLTNTSHYLTNTPCYLTLTSL